jgi:hypothetical protein
MTDDEGRQIIESVKAASNAAMLKLDEQVSSHSSELADIARDMPIAEQIPNVHVSCKYNSYVLYVEYYFECWVGDGDTQNHLVVPQVVLSWQHGETHGEEVVTNGSFVAKSDRTYNIGVDKQIRAVARVTMPSGRTWTNVASIGF